MMREGERKTKGSTMPDNEGRGMERRKGRRQHTENTNERERNNEKWRIKKKNTHTHEGKAHYNHFGNSRRNCLLLRPNIKLH